MTDQLPPPLVPPEVDLRDFQGMWVDTDRLLRSDTWLEGTGDQKAAAFSLWAESWHQVPAASLPTNDRLLARLSQAEDWSTAKAHALRGWVRCSDGRLYHPVVAEKALEAWVEKLASHISGATGNAKRWNVDIDTSSTRAQFMAAVAQLRELNPQSRVLKKKAVAVVLASAKPQQPGESPPESHPDSPPDSPPESTPMPRSQSKSSDPDRTDQTRTEQTRPDQNGLFREEGEEGGTAGAPRGAPPPTPPPAFDGTNGETLNGRAIVQLSPSFELPAEWGLAAEALGFPPGSVKIEAEKFRQYWAEGGGKGTRRSLKSWRQSWSNWLARAANDRDVRRR